MSQPEKIPGADHPITIVKNAAHLTVSVGGTAIARTDNALTLREASYPPVHYIPREDTDMAALARSDHVTHCPYKGDAAYFDIPALGERGRNAVWTYEAPYAAVAEIAGHLAFYEDRAHIEET